MELICHFLLYVFFFLFDTPLDIFLRVLMFSNYLIFHVIFQPTTVQLHNIIFLMYQKYSRLLYFCYVRSCNEHVIDTFFSWFNDFRMYSLQYNIKFQWSWFTIFNFAYISFYIWYIIYCDCMTFKHVEIYI